MVTFFTFFQRVRYGNGGAVTYRGETGRTLSQPVDKLNIELIKHIDSI